MELETIPGPPGLPIVGNIADIDAQNTILSLCNLTSKYGPLWKFYIGSAERIVIGSQALMDEVCDEERFSKIIAASLGQVRNGVHDGLFTATGPQEKNWGIAHRVLLPQLGPLAIRNMFSEMHDIASQLVMKWARHGPNHTIQVVDDFTRLTLDTIALCAMDYRFNSYYTQRMHPFVDAMADFLKVSGDRARRDAITQMFYRAESQKYWDDIELLRKTSQDVIKTRRENPTEKKDLLNGMLNGVDPKTGEKMTDESVIDNMITFLIAGHETTSGLLSFTFYYLLKNASAYNTAQQEVDDVIGKSPITVDHLSKLPYLNAVLRESLRLSPTAPSIGFTANEDTVMGGKFAVKAGTPIIAVFPMVHRDPIAYGEDAEEFRPERMLDDEFERRNKEFPNCWKPFGNGMRACIGRPFAWQEALLVLAMLLQNFNFTMEDSSYQLQIKQTLTIKPKGFYMRAHLRNHVSATSLERALSSATITDPPPAKGTLGGRKARTVTGKPMAIYYGSNTGTCEALANRLASDAANHGFRADVVDTLDSARENLPTDKPIVIITASYEGQPADNAAHFVNWVGALKETELDNVSYSVFGCGHRDWAKTFHKVPKYLNSTLESRGATRLVEMGSTDAAQGDIFTDFETWEDKVFWPAMREKYGSAEADGDSLETTLDVEVSSPRSSTLRQDVQEARVEEVEVLSGSGVAEKRHIEISLPSDMTYSAGDYLAILPLNPKENIHRAMRYFGLSWDSSLTISSAGPTTLPTDTPISAMDVLGAYVELAQPASKRNLLALLEATSDDGTKKELARLGDEAFTEEITTKRVSILDLLERFPSVQLPLGVFLKMQPPMRVRQYSISSSPLWNSNNVTLTYAVVDQPALSGQGRYVGVATNYLSNLTQGDKLHVSVRASHQAFHLPKDAKKVPVIMIAAGTGLAPFRGFIQERAAQLAAGRTLAPAILFYGCHGPDSDLLYPDLLKRWEQLGAVSLRYAFSRAAEQSEGCKHVQDRLYHDRADIVEQFEAGAKLFVCGSRGVGENVQEVLIKIAKERAREVQGREVDDAKAREWFEGLRNERFATDVFA
ncbi:NADPH-cytochrome P450 reductase-like protein [Cucurbitaria berberidis CBS 394.84]|uniref:Bifunctional cytochrome P450/NADPH--P450 reductase n=1 Tax=Cucurbitaria berberidis CBS 394.84 TaxID=1168544 RepID=A0A9P4G850_9PLEO|nr:NADPH-cytochrome P450 reductase-like protein [Cucurbitaria berberidis CBS 394.84]KAF1840671.1 NADPH-cytochrome P450 reductase-like protein [Cucurbitaria berberidis CBS 394.84]